MALTQISTDGIKNGTITGSDLATNVDLVDNQKLRLGTGNDLEIYHSGSNTFLTNNTGFFRIANTTGGLFLDGNDVTIRSEAGDENYAIFNNDGAVELFFNNAKKFETTSGGVEIPDGSVLTVQTTSTSNKFLSFLDIGNVGYEWKFPDNSTVQFGTNHGSDKRLQLNNEDASSHFHFSLADNGKMLFGNNDALQIFHDSNNSYIKDSGSGGLFIQGSGGGAGITLEDPDGNDFIKCIDEGTGGTVELYKAGTKRFHTTTSGVIITGLNATGSSVLGDFRFKDQDDNLDVHYDAENNKIVFHDNNKATFGTGDDLQIFHNGSDSIIDETGTGNLKIRNSGSNKLTVDGNGIILDGKITTIGSGYGSTVFNEDGADVDFRVEGDTQASLFKVDAGNDRVGIGESTPTVVFHATQFNHAFADSTSSLATVPTKSVARFRGSNNASGSLFIGNESSNARCYLQGCNETGNGSIDLLLNPFGANVGIGTTSPATKLHINGGTYAAPTGGNDGFTQLVISNQSAGQGAGIGLLGAGNMVTFIHFGDSDDANVGAIVYNNVVDSMQFYVNASERMNIDSSGNLNINKDVAKLRLGVHADLQLYHHGHSIIQNTNSAAAFLIASHATHIVNAALTENIAKFKENAEVELYYDNGLKFTTTTNGVSLFGDLRFNNGTWTGECLTGKIQTHSGHMYFQNASTSGFWIFRLPNGTEAATINSSGTYSSSDERRKKDITTITGAVDTIKKLTGKSFTWKEDNKKSFGLIAQEVETVLPDLITTQTVLPGETNSDPYKMVNYSALTGYFIEAIKELSTKIEVLETEVAALKAA